MDWVIRGTVLQTIGIRPGHRPTHDLVQYLWQARRVVVIHKELARRSADGLRDAVAVAIVGVGDLCMLNSPCLYTVSSFATHKRQRQVTVIELEPRNHRLPRFAEQIPKPKGTGSPARTATPTI